MKTHSHYMTYESFFQVTLFVTSPFCRSISAEGEAK